MAFRKNDIVQLIAPVIKGGIVDIKYNSEAEELEYLVAYTDDEGNQQQRWFSGQVLEVAL
jgi:hypothetical protein